jgi:hypothetical protein
VSGANLQLAGRDAGCACSAYERARLSFRLSSSRSKSCECEHDAAGSWAILAPLTAEPVRQPDPHQLNDRLLFEPTILAIAPGNKAAPRFCLALGRFCFLSKRGTPCASDDSRRIRARRSR